MAGREQANHPPSPAGLPVIDGYSDLQLIGRGGYSQVYTAWQERFARTVAIKVITVELSDTAVRRFGREQATTGQLDGHPHVIRVYDSGFTEQHQPYLTMEYHEQGSLADRVRLDGPMPVDEVLAIGVKLACALDAAHSRGTIHRDVKPQNVLISPFVGPVLADFGIAAVDDARIRTITSEAFSALHVAPEVLEGHQAVPTSDLYSLASTMYELLSGKAPFADNDDPGLLALMRRVRTESLPPIGRDDIPPALSSALSVMLAREPEDRPESGVAMAEALRSVQIDVGWEPTPLVLDPGGSSSLSMASRGTPSSVSSPGRDPDEVQPAEVQPAGGDPAEMPAPSWAKGPSAPDLAAPPPAPPPAELLGASSAPPSPATEVPEEPLETTGPRSGPPEQSPTPRPTAGSGAGAGSPPAAAGGSQEPDLETTGDRGPGRQAAQRKSGAGAKQRKRPPNAPPTGGEDPLTHTIERSTARRGAEPKPLIAEEEKKSRLPLIIGLSTVLVLLVGAAGWFFLIRDTGDDEEQATSTTTTEPDPADIVPPCPETLSGERPFQQGFEAGQPPTSLQLEQSPDGASAHLTWDDPNDGGNYYMLYVRCESEDQNNLPLVAITSPGDPTEATIEGLSLDHNYCFTVGVLQPEPIDDEGNFIELTSGDPACLDDPSGPAE